MIVKKLGFFVEDQIECNNFQALVDKIQESIESFGIWNTEHIKISKRVVKNLLTNDEYAISKKYTHSKNKKDYVLARILLKMCILNELGLKMHPCNMKLINIKKNEDGSPLLLVNGKEERNIGIAISHKENYIFAAAKKGRKIGVDIEKISTRFMKVKSKIFNLDEEEILLNNSKDLDDQVANLTRLWSSKESIVKLTKLALFDTKKHIRLLGIKDENLIFNYKNKKNVQNIVCPTHLYNGYIFSFSFVE